MMRFLLSWIAIRDGNRMLNMCNRSSGSLFAETSNYFNASIIHEHKKSQKKKKSVFCVATSVP